MTKVRDAWDELDVADWGLFVRERTGGPTEIHFFPVDERGHLFSADGCICKPEPSFAANTWSHHRLQ